MLTRLMVVALLLTAPGFAQAQKSALASGPKVELKGTIEKIQLEKGQGVPYLELKTEKGTQKVVLGSMRYLMEKNFNPKAGEPATVKGFQMNDDVMAQTVTLTESNTTLALRDDNGMPLWRGGKQGGGQGQHKKQ